MKMDMLQSATAAHLHGDPMAHCVAAQLRPFLSEIDCIEASTELYEYDVVKLPVKQLRDVWLWGHASKLPKIDYDRVPTNFPRPSGGLASGCVWTFSNNHIVEITHQTGNHVYYCADSWDVWAVVAPPSVCGDKHVIAANGTGTATLEIPYPEATDSESWDDSRNTTPRSDK